MATASLNSADTEQNPRVTIETTFGEIVVELFADKAPITVANFLSLVDADFYSGLIFHRVMDGFMVQGGGFDANMAHRQYDQTIVNEDSNGLSNERGTLAMARTSDPDSAGSQFFINVVDNSFLDRTDERRGYAVFGKVIDGMSVVDKIKAVPVGTSQGHQNVPTEPVVITKMSRVASSQ